MKNKTQEEIDAITKKMHDDINSIWEDVFKRILSKKKATLL